MKHRFTLLTVALVLLGSWITGARAAPLSVDGAGLAITVDPSSGDYTIARNSPPWVFRGSIGQPLANPQSRGGRDSIGAYTAIAFDWQSDGPKTGEIRAYPDKSVVLFILTCHSPQAKPPAAFPSLSPPQGLHLFSYGESTFAPPRFTGQPGGSPWLMFDDAAHSAILSPASNFMTASIRGERQAEPAENTTEEGAGTTRPSSTASTRRASTRPSTRPVERANKVRTTTDGTAILSGLSGKVRDIPADFSHRTLLAFGDGVGATWTSWGAAMIHLSEKVCPASDADVGLSTFGYWTDNGAGYYYNYDASLGYAGTLLALNRKMHALGIPLGYVQLDSWWYSKTNFGPDGKVGEPFKNKNLPRGAWNLYGGLLEYRAHPDLFPDGLPAFQKKMNVPLVTHNRWIDPRSPYHENYRISGVGAVDPKWWDDITDYLKSSGVVTYEQDWLDRIYKYSPEFQTTIGVADAFLDNMARACRERGMTMQYCMELPRHYLQGTRYDNLTSVRVAGDRFGRDKWEPALYVSQMASALGEWPWVDTFDSRETPNLILATLTAGMVGVGDKIDQIDADNIRKVIRADGVIVKPDTAVVPIDQTWLNDAAGKEAPMIAAAYCGDGAMRTAYVFAYPRNGRQMAIHVTPAELGITGDAYVYEPATGAATRVAAGSAFDATFKDVGTAKEPAWAYFVVAPVTRSGIALLGDQSKFVTMGRKRISKVEETAEEIRATIEFAPGEQSVPLFGFAATEPNCGGDRVGFDRSGYSAKTGEFRFDIMRPANASEVTVTLRAK
jgi:hypothetical protein